jgi:hypothetical protein
MKLMKLAVAAVFAMGSSSAYAFHDGGVAECDGCHVMHNAKDGVSTTTFAGNALGGHASAVAPRTNVTNSFLLQGSDQSSTCLMCHGQPKAAFGSDYHIADLLNATIPTNRTPGGDFGWLSKSFSWTAWGSTLTSAGERHGHNIVAADFSLVADTMRKAPGGDFAVGTGKAAFACSNCHDPHGRYRMQGTSSTAWTIVGPSTPGSRIDPIVSSGSYGAAPAAGQAVGVYRLLAGAGYSPASNPAFPFPNNPPVAVAKTSYNVSEAAAQNIVAYGTGMGEWCQNCHTNIHLDAYVTGTPGLRHPAGSDAKFRSTQANIYNSYLSSGNLTATAQYSSLVPFESGSRDLTALQTAANAADAAALVGNTTNTLLQASTSSNVMCLSCHRAHASAFDSILRWDMGTTFITDGSGYTVVSAAATARSVAQTQAGYYDRPVGASGLGYFQRSLCNKCHAKD